MVMVKSKLALCDRYVVKERGQHRDRCASIESAYSLEAEDGTQLGCGWVGNIEDYGLHYCPVGKERAFQLLKRCHDYGAGRIAEKDAEIAKLKERLPRLD
jgi:hypothetical protein